MFSRKPKTLVLIFNKEKIIPLHMLFVFFPIDVIFLDREKKVVEVKIKFRPWHFYSPKKKAQYAIELPTGTIQKTGTQLGDLISF